MDFKIGDGVRLKEGFSPIMTVSDIDTPDQVTCKWYSGKEEKFIFETFHKDMLKPYTKSAAGKTRGHETI